MIANLLWYFLYIFILSVSTLFMISLFSLQVIAKYLIDYPVDEDIKGYFDHFLKNLSYDIEYGRESSLEMLAFFYSELPLVRKTNFVY